MKELQKNNLIEILVPGKASVGGYVVDFLDDRVLVEVDKSGLEIAKQFKELEEYRVAVQTVLGRKHMDSCIISTLNTSNRLILENADTIAVECQRSHVRVDCNFDFVIKINASIITANAINISGGGVAFYIDKPRFENGDIINIVLPASSFGKVLECKLKILKMEQKDSRYFCAGQFSELSVYNEDAIVKYSFKLMSHSSNGK